MKKQKKRFLTFICSLIPGAGELYMGFEKQGMSILIIFWGIVAISALTGMTFILCLLPIIWFYSFFHTQFEKFDRRGIYAGKRQIPD